MLRPATFLRSRGLFNEIINRGMFIQNTSQYRKKLKPIKGISTDCEEHPSPVCPPQPCLMDWVPVPQGCWKEKYERDNKEHSKDLLLGAASLLLSLIALYKTGWVKGYDVNLFFEKD